MDCLFDAKRYAFIIAKHDPNTATVERYADLVAWAKDVCNALAYVSALLRDSPDGGFIRDALWECDLLGVRIADGRKAIEKAEGDPVESGRGD